MSNEKQHTLILENRSEMRMTGVKDIGSFSDTKIILDTALGELTVRGEELHVIGLDPETGDFSMTGRVKSLMYSSFSSRDNIFGRLFR